TAFQNEWGVPHGTSTALPAAASTRSSPRTNPSLPSSTYHASSSEKCTCSGAIGRSADVSPSSRHSAITKSPAWRGPSASGSASTRQVDQIDPLAVYLTEHRLSCIGSKTCFGRGDRGIYRGEGPRRPTPSP